MTAPPPQVVATVPGLVHAVRQEGARIGWLSGACYTVTVRIGGKLVRLGTASSECTNEEQPLFAVGSSGAAIWVHKVYGNTTYQYVKTPHFSTEIDGETAIADGNYVVDVAATGKSLFYSVLVEQASDGCFDGMSPCTDSVMPASYVARVVGSKRTKVAGIPPALMLDANEGRLAVVEAEPAVVRDQAKANGAVDVYAVPSFRKVASATLAGRIRDVAVSRSALAVLTPGAIHVGSTTIAVPHDVAHISLSGRNVAYASGNSVYVDGHVVARRTIKPIGVSISGGRVVWAERSTIYALEVYPSRT